MKVLAAIVILLCCRVVAAEPPRMASVTFSPIHLIFPVLEVNAEFHVAHHTGLGVIGALGKVTSGSTTGTASELGGQFNYYFMRQFAGVHAGVEVLEVHVSNVTTDSSIAASGLSAGPYVGYKALLPVGFTFVAQLGVDFVVVKASSSTTVVNEKKVFPLLNLNFGWSF